MGAKHIDVNDVYDILSSSIKCLKIKQFHIYEKPAITLFVYTRFDEGKVHVAEDGKMRIAKFIAHAGICSRREAERMIEEGKVEVNGECIGSPALNVSDEDRIFVNGVGIKQKKDKPRLFLMNKPSGTICTTKDTHDRPTVFDILPKGLPRLVSVGRLDLTSEGLLLFTDSPALADKLMAPNNGLERVYRVRISGNLRGDQKEKLERGMTIDGIKYQGVKVYLEEEDNKVRNSWIQLTLKEGKNREIRKLMESLGLQVSRLVRLSYGPFELGKLPKKVTIEVPWTEIDKLNKQVNK